MKYVIKWTIGNTKNNNAFKCLFHSINLFQKKFKNKFEYNVYYNNIDEKLLIKNFKYDVKYTNQEQTFKNFLDIPPKGPAWKLYPARTNINSYEILIDNDLVVYNFDIIEKFMADNKIYITEGLERRFGKYDKIISSNLRFNSGLICLPPGFDLNEKIQKNISKNDSWDSHFDEQGLLSYIITKENYVLIRLQEIFVCLDKLVNSKNGLHFVGLNSGHNKLWSEYVQKSIKI